MVIPFTIPKKLQPFAPILVWINDIPQEDLNEDLDTTRIGSFFRSHYGNLEANKFEARWESDRKAFNKLVKIHGPVHPWLYFIEAHLLSAPHILADLQLDRAEDNQLPPPLVLHVNLPHDFAAESDYGTIRAKSEHVELELIPTAESVLDFKLQNLRQQDEWQAEKQRTRLSFVGLDWGAVKGWKVITGISDSKYITYLLKVPGGACFAEARCTPRNFDESSFETHLRSVTVEATT
jgi:hypothetical protein